jgi:hypothetical protein
MKVLEDGVSCICNAGEVVAKIVYGFRKDVEKSVFSLTTHGCRTWYTFWILHVQPIIYFPWGHQNPRILDGEIRALNRSILLTKPYLV